MTPIIQSGIFLLLLVNCQVTLSKSMRVAVKEIDVASNKSDDFRGFNINYDSISHLFCDHIGNATDECHARQKYIINNERVYVNGIHVRLGIKTNSLNDGSHTYQETENLPLEFVHDLSSNATSSDYCFNLNSSQEDVTLDVCSKYVCQQDNCIRKCLRYPEYISTVSSEINKPYPNYPRAALIKYDSSYQNLNILNALSDARHLFEAIFPCENLVKLNETWRFTSNGTIILSTRKQTLTKTEFCIDVSDKIPNIGIYVCLESLNKIKHRMKRELIEIDEVQHENLSQNLNSWFYIITLAVMPGFIIIMILKELILKCCKSS